MDDSINAARASIALRIVVYWLPVAIMIGAMYYFSTEALSNDKTRRTIEKTFLWFVPHASDHTLSVVNYMVRKSAHVAEYALLAALLFRAFRADRPVRWRFKWALYSFLSASSWALLDELHQSFTRTRGGSIRDTLLDSTGALFALIVIAMVSRKKTGDYRRSNE